MSDARCSCGALRIHARGEPYAVVACHCRACQRRTGSALGVGVYFADADVIIEGEARAYDRAVEGRRFRSFFCPRCGTSLYWRTDLHPTAVAVALGAFEDPSRFVPDRSVWEVSRCGWLGVDASVPGHVEGSRSPASR